MEYSKLMSITGMPGLFELVGNRTDGAIVKNLEDSSIKFVSSRVNTFSHLETIEVFTIRENVNLVEIFIAMEKSEEPIPSEKDPKAVKAYFTIVYPEMDFDRVYPSDMKKMVKWFNVLKKNEVPLKLSEAPAGEEGDDEEAEG
ncbi:DUF5606 domain-containing protein [Parasediminibacterium sp. JCM 36343]|uniref:DUF5606 family protein n=1 Tax=Parasediminibacterium sp. JCM 36343 TaxID=3374279 RepID=UPI00397DA154